MIFQQTQNAFNDKVAQFLLIPLAAAIGASVESQAGLMIALPFVLFAPLSGWLSDRFSKRDVMIAAAGVQVLVLAWISAAVANHHLNLAMIGFFALATQAAFFSPAKFGITKELLGSKHLGFATGIQQMTVMLAMLIGQIVAGFGFDWRLHAMGGHAGVAWQAALVPLLVLTITSIPTLAIAWAIPRVPAQDLRPFTPRLIVSHFLDLRSLWTDRSLRSASLGVAFFWAFGGFVNLWSIKLAKALTGGGGGFGSLSSQFMAAASLGMACGFGAASSLMRRRIELGWVPLAGIAMTLLALLMAWMPAGGPLFLVTLGLLAFSSAMFLAPLHAWMQDRYPAEKRGELQSAANLQNCLSGVLAVLLVTAMEALAAARGIDAAIGLRLQMVFLAIACGFATLLVIRMLPADLVRVIGVTLVRMIYRIRRVDSDRVPRAGGVLLLPNHVTFADAFFLSAACPRPLRFVMDEVFMRQPAIRAFTRLFDTVTIRRDQPLDAIREIIRALRQGDAVCLFPEGQLTRTGGLCPLQRGFELIAKKAAHPLVPVWCDGSWGSIFSFERHRFFCKWPRPLGLGMTVAYGKPLDPAAANLSVVRDALLETSAAAVGHRFERRRWISKRPERHHPLAETFMRMAPGERQRTWANGYQIGMLDAIPRRKPFYVLASDPAWRELPALCVAFSALFRAPMRVMAAFDGSHDATWIGGDTLRDVILHSNLSAAILFHDFGPGALRASMPGLITHCPALAMNGCIVAMSMPDPAPAADDFLPQSGHKPHSWGKLLPGWFIRERDGLQFLHGPAAPDDGWPLPSGSILDAECFLLGSRQ